ncbi:hypothetical protein [Murimonas intestini]|uniref:Uncharacterized protein n=1 Tax=Murimonas intestini TaxID=1337051 RepID=A0AB73T442_9FIRM|nr:hypothetical protein [Murimonas intestini]MCR1840844.1 hypothetical protein [Murimonas intestini]MCR1866037.1 hypothetical protein [Murimonas intestini]MCR1883457.1 hypothetical protein [Murimonas intestini]
MGELLTRKRGKTREYSFEGARVDGKRNPISKVGFRTRAEECLPHQRSLCPIIWITDLKIM